MTTQSTAPLTLFYSYAHADERLRNRLEKHLTMLKQEGYISNWHDRKILPGEEWQQKIDASLNNAQIVLLLVSDDFLASNYCYGIEMKRALERHEAGEALVIPVILRKVDWHTSPFSKLQALPKDGKPVISWSNRDEAFYDVAQGIRRAIDAFRSQKTINKSDSLSQKPSQSTSPTESDHSNLQRPATVMLSYAHEDMEEIQYFQVQLKVRGVRTWRDATNLPIGGLISSHIVHAIEQESDAFVIYITPQSLRSDFIWNVEVPAALKRHEHDPLFNIVPILRGVTFLELQRHCAARSLPPLTDFNAERLPDTISADTENQLKARFRLIAGRVLKATLPLRLHRANADHTYEPWIRLCTFDNKPPTPYLDLDLDWWDLFRDRELLPTAEEWRDILFPALREIKSALSEQPIKHNLHISMKAIIPVAFALGYTFPFPSSFTLLPESNNGTWSTVGTPASLPNLRRTLYPGSGDKHVSVIEIAISNSTAMATEQYLIDSALSYGHHIRYDLPGGPDQYEGVKDASQALAIARYIGREFKNFNGVGITHIHLFTAIPVALAVLLGHQFNALCPISLYQFVNGRYERACVLG